MSDTKETKSHELVDGVNKEEEGGEEDVERENWSGKLDFFLSALSYSGYFRAFLLLNLLFSINLILLKKYVSSRFGSGVAFSVFMLQKRRRCFPRSVLFVSSTRRHSDRVHGAFSWTVYLGNLRISINFRFHVIFLSSI